MVPETAQQWADWQQLYLLILLAQFGVFRYHPGGTPHLMLQTLEVPVFVSAWVS